METQRVCDTCVTAECSSSLRCAMFDWISWRQSETADSLHKHTDGVSICTKIDRILVTSVKCKVQINILINDLHWMTVRFDLGVFRPQMDAGLSLYPAVCLLSRSIDCKGASTSFELLIVLPVSCLHFLLLLESCRVKRKS